MIPLTGLVNSLSDTRLQEYLDAQCEVLPKIVRRTVSFLTSSGRVSYTVRFNVPDGDVGDAAVVISKKQKGKKKPLILYGESDAESLVPGQDNFPDEE